MFKRANKITSLLVAAAAVVSIVPASAADVKKVDSQDGVVYSAVAYKGADLVDGTVNDNDAAYYLKDGKYTQLADVDSGSDYTVYGEKYVQVDDGSDYNVDLSTGKVLDSDVASDNEDDAASALRKKIKDSDRYGDVTTGTGTSAVYGDADIADLTVIPGAKFGEVWYSAKYAVDSTKKGASTAASYDVYTDSKGNYIDADYNLGKIKIETTSVGAITTSASVTIENTKDDYKLRADHDTFAEITATRVLGQDKDNIYRYAKIEVTTVADRDGNALINGKSFPVVSGKVTLNVIQKISKAQDSDDVDDGKYAKTVTNYVISDDAGAPNASYLAYALAGEARVIGGKLAIFTVTNSKTDDNVKIQAATLKSKNGFYYTDVEDEAKITTEFDDDLDKAAFDTDVDGNIYVIDAGYIKKFDGTDDFEKVYKVDGSMNAISAYDKDNMIVWSQADEVYSVIGGKKSTDTDTTTAPAVTAGWAKATDGTWTFVKADGTKATGWYQDGATWYYLGATGTMATGWQNVGGTWYYLAGSGAMVTGWFTDATGTWYYTNASGAMLANTVVDGYKLGASGAWVK
jgi:hypothetical protein